MDQYLTFIGSNAVSGKRKKPLLFKWILRRSGYTIFITLLSNRFDTNNKQTMLRTCSRAFPQYGDDAFDDESEEGKDFDTYFVFPRLGTISPLSGKATS